MQPTKENQRFTVTEKLAIQDSNFIHDANLLITGDFASMEDKQSYVECLVEALNGYEELKQHNAELHTAAEESRRAFEVIYDYLINDRDKKSIANYAKACAEAVKKSIAKATS